jgi:hypothetical protein
LIRFVAARVKYLVHVVMPQCVTYCSLLIPSNGTPGTALAVACWFVLVLVCVGVAVFAGAVLAAPEPSEVPGAGVVVEAPGAVAGVVVGGTVAVGTVEFERAAGKSTRRA